MTLCANVLNLKGLNENLESGISITNIISAIGHCCTLWRNLRTDLGLSPTLNSNKVYWPKTSR
jgi:hypothetical protein